ncbi:hypothetical protein RFI_15084 [Reticulomyxa filosa]|uniref:Uncharacterized protein n=1 Tax=Reticulomyxa filosa TaxID=46433 RepID=X6N9Z1_RETFI|nr:hypothetical protein RFI_15084 [Reticulomyxa filosa]|eukprot:ETO22122.1 hypothetical protein RFI_15084 [Reticulomyxa filosa]
MSRRKEDISGMDVSSCNKNFFPFLFFNQFFFCSFVCGHTLYGTEFTSSLSFFNCKELFTNIIFCYCLIYFKIIEEKIKMQMYKHNLRKTYVFGLQFTLLCNINVRNFFQYVFDIVVNFACLSFLFFLQAVISFYDCCGFPAAERGAQTVIRKVFALLSNLKQKINKIRQVKEERQVVKVPKFTCSARITYYDIMSNNSFAKTLTGKNY